MGAHQLRRMPVVDAQRRVVGIIAQADVATRIAQPTTTGALVEAISKNDDVAPL
jgi:CBS-domain-containing membrane protein